MASSSKVLVVRPVRSNMLSHAKEQTHFPKWNAFFYWPESGPVTIPDWLNHEDFHEDFGWCGWLWGKGDYNDWCSSRYPDKVLVVEVEASDITTTKSGKIKFTEGNVIFCGTFETVTKFMKERGHTGMVYGIDKDPNNSKAIVGDGGTAVVGYCGSAKAGKNGKALAGDQGFAEAGENGYVVVGENGTAIVGMGGVAMAGVGGSITIHWASKLGTAYTTTGKAFVGPNYYGDVERIESDVPYCIKKGRLVIAES